jgi:hypothetical protein
VLDGSFVLIENRGNNRAGDIVANMTDMVTVRGLSVDNQALSSLMNNNRSSGRGGDIRVTVPQVFVRDRGGIRASSTSTGNGGDIIVRASDLVYLDNQIVDANGRLLVH